MRWYRSTQKDSPLSRQAVKELVHLSVISIVRFRSASRI